MGQGYVGLPVAVRAVEAGFDVVGFDVDRERVDSAARGESFIDDVTDDELAECWRPAASGRRPTRPTSPASTSPSSPCRRRCATARPTSRYIESAADAARAPRAAGLLRRPRVDHLPGHDRGGLRPDPRGEAPGCVPAPTSAVGYSPERIDPGNPTVELPQHPEDRLGHRRRVARRGRRRSTPRSSTRRCRSAASRKRSWPSCSRTRSGTSTSPSSTSWRCSPTSSASTSGRPSTPRADQAVRVHAVHARPGRRRALPADRPVVPVVAGPAAPRPGVPLRRARQRRQRAHARLRRRAGVAAKLNARRARRSTARRSCCSASPTRRTPATPASRRRSTSSRSCSSSRRRGRRPSTRWSTDVDVPARRDAGRRWTPRSSPRPTPWSCSPTTTTSTGMRSPRSPTRCSTPATGWQVPGRRSCDPRSSTATGQPRLVQSRTVRASASRAIPSCLARPATMSTTSARGSAGPSDAPDVGTPSAHQRPRRAHRKPVEWGDGPRTMSVPTRTSLRPWAYSRRNR